MSDASSTPTMPEVPGLPGMTALLRHQAWLRRLAASLVADAARADDLTQQALLAALERPPADATRPWLAAVARNLARRLGASDLRRADRERAVAPSELLPATDDLVAQAALQHEMSAALLALEEPYRSTLLLRYFRDWKPRAIAQELRIPVATVRTRLARGLEQLRAAVVTRRGAPDRGKALALLGLCGGAARRELRRALLAAAAKDGVVASGSAAAAAGAVGVLGMSLQMKLAAGVLVIAGSVVAVWKSGTSTATSVVPAIAHDENARLSHAPGESAADSTSNSTAAPPSPSREAVESNGQQAPPTPSHDLGSVLVSVVWGRDGTAAVDVGVTCEQGGIRIHERTTNDGSTVFEELHRKTREARDSLSGASEEQIREQVIEVEQAADSAKRAVEAEENISSETRDAVLGIHDSLSELKEEFED